MSGRIRLDVDRSKVEFLRSLSFTWSEVSTILGVSIKTLQRRANDWNLLSYTDISMDYLDTIVQDILLQFPLCGEVMLLNEHLKSRGIRVQRYKLRNSIHSIRGHRNIQPCIRRRSYNVPGPNYLWHADGNHKLIRYKLVIHAAVDGFSRLITYLNCANNNRAETVLSQFMNATLEFGVPSRIRTDRGSENVGIWRYMEFVRGEGRASYIAGSSVHNSRIERLWRDIRIGVTLKFSTIFQTLEDAGVLCVDNETDLFCLHYIFIPRINEALKSFQQAWNSHGLSTECNWSPMQLFTAYSYGNPLFDDANIDIQRYGVDEEEDSNEHYSETQSEGVVVPSISCPLSTEGNQILESLINPLQHSDSYGADLYVNTVHLVYHVM